MRPISAKLYVPGSTGRVPASGWVQCEPTRRVVVEGSPDTIVLPKPFRLTIPADGILVLNLDETGPDWCWKLTEGIDGTSGHTRYVAVTSTDTDYGDLADVDPATLVATPTTEAVWASALASKQDKSTLDADVQAKINDQASSTRAALNASFAPWMAARPGNLCVFLGDSITAGSDDNTNRARGISWPNYAAMISGQRIQYVRNSGVPGNTTAQMLARFDTDVTPYKPNVVTLLCGTNDLNVTDFTAWAGQVQAIVGKIRAIGAVPVLCTVPPTNTDAKKQAVSQFNGFLHHYSAQQGIALVPFFTLLADPANSNYKAAYFNDGTHPNSAGYQALGKLAADTLSPLLPTGSPILCADDIDPNNALTKGTFAGYSGSALPSGWVDSAGTPAGSTLSYTTDANIPGQLVTITQSAAAGVRQLSYSAYMGQTTLSSAVSAGATSLTLPIRADYGGVLFIGSGATFEVAKISSSSGGGPQTETLARPLKYAHAAGEPVVVNGVPGDELIFSGIVTSDGGVTIKIDTSMPGATYSPTPASNMSGSLTRAVFYQRFSIPTSTAGAMAFRLQAAAGTGVVSFGQVGVYNATRLGW